MKPMIEVRSLRKVYQVEDESVVALDHIDLNIEEGEICCIFGPSGSGKSTLLNELAGFEKPTEGGIRICGQVITKMNEDELAIFRQKKTGFIFQAYNLLPSMTALENTASPLLFCGIEKNRRERIAQQILKQVGLEKRMNHYPNQMSGGQQQRVGIARAFVAKPKVVFADEPTGNLDSKSSKIIMDLIRTFSRKYHQTIVMVSHSPEAASYADHIVHLLDGRIIEESYPGKEKEKKELPYEIPSP